VANLPSIVKGYRCCKVLPDLDIVLLDSAVSAHFQAEIEGITGGVATMAAHPATCSNFDFLVFQAVGVEGESFVTGDKTSMIVVRLRIVSSGRIIFVQYADDTRTSYPYIVDKRNADSPMHFAPSITSTGCTCFRLRQRLSGGL
jgi:hypothetical protein